MNSPQRIGFGDAGESGEAGGRGKKEKCIEIFFLCASFARRSSYSGTTGPRLALALNFLLRVALKSSSFSHRKKGRKKEKGEKPHTIPHQFLTPI
jgi:hypothetical protein